MKKTKDLKKETKEIVMKDELENVRYDEELFVVVDSENKENIISEFCRNLFRYNLSDSEREMDNRQYEYEAELELLIKKFPTPFTIVQEFYHIDRSYRDSYYTYFSNQHFQVKRYSRRLSFFGAEITEEDFFIKTDKDINNLFIGSCVINPITTGAIGKTLINPKYIIDKKPVYMRLSKFTLHLYGK